MFTASHYNSVEHFLGMGTSRVLPQQAMRYSRDPEVHSERGAHQRESADEKKRKEKRYYIASLPVDQD